MKDSQKSYMNRNTRQEEKGDRKKDLNTDMKKSLTIDIIYEDPDIIVCRKPAGVPTQTARISSPDMVSMLKSYLAGKEDPGLRKQENTFSPRKRQGEPYLALIHRLDQPVEGLLVFARTRTAASRLNQQLGASGFGKYYLAAAEGRLDPAEGTLENYLVKDSRTNTSRICGKDTPGAKSARLYYQTIRTCGTCSILKIQLDTGRHHQIRVQMAGLGHPLKGDRKYGAARQDGPLCLCASRLEFSHPVSGRKMTFEITPAFLDS